MQKIAEIQIANLRQEVKGLNQELKRIFNVKDKDVRTWGTQTATRGRVNNEAQKGNKKDQRPSLR